MGLYWTTFVLNGIYIKSNIVVPTNIDKKWIMKCGGGYFLYIPSTYKQLPTIDPIIDNGDMKQGYVALADLIKFKYVGENHFDILTSDTNILENCISELQKVDPTGSYNVSKHIVEGMWSTLDPNDMSFSMTRMLPIQ